MVNGTWIIRQALIAVLASAISAQVGCGQRSVARARPRQDNPTLVVPEHGAYTGAYIESGDREDEVTLEKIEEFEELTGKHQAIIAFSSYWGEQHFPALQAGIVIKHGAVPLIYWSPWDYPYNEELIEMNGPDKFRLENILSGKWDDYIDHWADGVKAQNSPVFVSIGNEMNGNWFPWSARYYGAGRIIAGTDPPRYVGPEYFKRAYRYIVDRVRARGAKNVLWVFHLNNFPEPYEAWNSFAQLYPGADYVDWLGLSVYGQMFSEDPKWNSFDDVISKPYTELCQLDPQKPIMLAEWAVGEFPERGDKGAWITNGFEQMVRKYPRLHAAVYWHERWQNEKTDLYSNMKIDSSPQALAAYRRGLASPYWLGQPIFR